MTHSGRVFKGGIQLGGGQAVYQACSFLRTVIVARLVAPADFGVAATFSITISVLEMLGNIGVEKLLIQAKDGDEQRFQACAQMILALRGIVAGVLLWLLAQPLARLFGVPEAGWAFQWLALVPMLRGLGHFDMYRLQREMKFGRVVLVETVTSLSMLLAAWPLAYWLRDYSAMLLLLILHAAAMVAGSFMVAKRPYQWVWDRGYAGRMVAFGWPLVINSLLLFCIMQGDRFIIGTSDQLFGGQRYSLADLGAYSAAFTMTMAPAGVLAKICTSLFLPLFSRKQESGVDAEQLYVKAAQFCAAVSGLFVLPFVLCGTFAVVAIYGEKYRAGGEVIAWLASMQAVRTARIVPTLAAMSRADTRNAMIANLWRMVSFGVAFYLAYRGAGMKWIAVAGFGGEVVSWAVSVALLRKDHGIRSSVWVKSTMQVMVVLLLAAGLGPLLSRQWWVWQVAATAVCAVIFVGYVGVVFPQLRAHVERSHPLLMRISRIWDGHLATE